MSRPGAQNGIRLGLNRLLRAAKGRSPTGHNSPGHRELVAAIASATANPLQQTAPLALLCRRVSAGDGCWQSSSHRA